MTAPTYSRRWSAQADPVQWPSTTTTHPLLSLLFSCHPPKIPTVPRPTQTKHDRQTNDTGRRLDRRARERTKGPMFSSKRRVRYEGKTDHRPHHTRTHPPLPLLRYTSQRHTTQHITNKRRKSSRRRNRTSPPPKQRQRYIDDAHPHVREKPISSIEEVKN